MPPSSKKSSGALFYDLIALISSQLSSRYAESISAAIVISGRVRPLSSVVTAKYSEQRSGFLLNCIANIVPVVATGQAEAIVTTISTMCGAPKSFSSRNDTIGRASSFKPATRYSPGFLSARSTFVCEVAEPAISIASGVFISDT